MTFSCNIKHVRFDSGQISFLRNEPYLGEISYTLIKLDLEEDHLQIQLSFPFDAKLEDKIIRELAKTSVNEVFDLLTVETGVFAGELLGGSDNLQYLRDPDFQSGGGISLSYEVSGITQQVVIGSKDKEDELANNLANPDGKANPIHLNYYRSANQSTDEVSKFMFLYMTLMAARNKEKQSDVDDWIVEHSQGIKKEPT